MDNDLYCQYVDMVNSHLCCRDEEFSVSSVLASDVIHATRKDIPCIFRVGDPAGSSHVTFELHVF